MSQEGYEIYNAQYLKRIEVRKKYKSSVENIRDLYQGLLTMEEYEERLRGVKRNIRERGGRASSEKKLALFIANKDTENETALRSKALQRAYRIESEAQYAKAMEQYKADLEEYTARREDGEKGLKRPKKPKKEPIPTLERIRYGEDEKIYELVRKRRKELSQDPNYTQEDLGRIIASEIFGSP